MKCILCKRMLRSENKYNLCSNCGNRTLGTLMKSGAITPEMLHSRKK